MDYLLHHLLMNAADRYPDKDAIICGDKRISYRELDDVTNQLARLLLKLGVQQGDRVGIYINKSIPSIISIHGILKAGAVYVPLDPQAPATRLAYIIDNCQINCLLTSAARLTAVKAISEIARSLEFAILTDDNGGRPLDMPIKMHDWQTVIAQQAPSYPGDLSINTDLAYILYTSGSTGTPKGVMISHLNSLTFVYWAYDTLKIVPEDRLSNHAPLHFDLSIFDIFAAFKAGATLVLVPETLSMFPLRLANWIDDNQISVWYSVPSILSMMVLHGQLDQHRFERLRMILFAGEVFPVKFLRELMDMVPQRAYFNLYGPTETNVITYYQVPPIPPDQITPIPIGKRCANMDVFALTADGRRVTEPGQVGELMARGSCVAQGYWGDEVKTREGFVMNTTQTHFREIIYKTGDLVTIDADGNYIYIGRKDGMIKSRGYRIELGDIETTLYSHPEIKEAAVVPIPDDVVGNRIKAVIVLRTSGLLTNSDIRHWCAEALPKYMVPDIIEFRDVLPKTSTGKVDKAMLASESGQ